VAVDFSIEGIIDVIAQALCGGSTVIAGLLVMCGAFFLITVIFAAMRAPIHYALVPMILIDIVFTALGVINTTISFLIIVVCAVLMARQVRDLVTGD
jgi:predicted benzoate:H+ symporter BenE